MAATNITPPNVLFDLVSHSVYFFNGEKEM